jgi:hypothetical protein
MPITLNNAGRAKLSKKSRLRESAQGDKWSFCLTADKTPEFRRGLRDSDIAISILPWIERGGHGAPKG